MDPNHPVKVIIPNSGDTIPIIKLLPAVIPLLGHSPENSKSRTLCPKTHTTNILLWRRVSRSVMLRACLF